MSIRKDGVSFGGTVCTKGRGVFVGLLILEAVFSFFLYLTLAGHIFAPNSVESAAGIPQLLSYQGRLTDTSGNPLGGAGTVYCFRYSIYDAVSGGSRLWPAATSTNATTTVVDGVFSDNVGRVDALNIDFFATSTIYLNVDVNPTTSTCAGTWESLTPRQQITAAGYALSADDVYGAALRTPTSTKVQVGTGAGVSSGQTLLSLDVKNTTDTIGGACTDNGSLWYNSTSSHALICEGSKIQQIGNGEVIIGISSNATTTIISSGSVQLSGVANITVNQTGNTIGFSVAAGGGAAVSRYMWPAIGGLSAITAPAQGTMSIVYVPIGEQLTATRMDVAMSFALGSSATANTAGVAISQTVGIYSKNALTLFSLSTASNQQTISWASNSGSYLSINGMRLMSVPININATPGDYFVIYNVSTAQSSIGTATTALSPGMSIFGQTMAIAGVNAMNWGSTALTSANLYGGMGVYASQVNSNPGNLSLSAINQTGTHVSKANIWIQFRNI